LPAQNAGQFFYAKAFDKFAPVGPVLVSPEIFRGGNGVRLITRVNGQVMQDSEIRKDMVFSPAKVLSFMSQSEWPIPDSSMSNNDLLSNSSSTIVTAC
jgi:2-keto-4-pentenoate hydratase/2-oxohepta-3-ene-1,7-dioic acid hydratase in catechol pathway